MKEYFGELKKLIDKLAQDYTFQYEMGRAVEACTEALQNGRKLIVAGNGGSAADAQHFAAEFIGKYKKERKAYPAIALTTNSSVLTAWSNDYEFDSVFARQLEALGKQGDVFLAISTSGNSPNLLQGAHKAREIGIKVIGITGNEGGLLKGKCDINLIVPSNNTPRIQEIHTLILHSIVEEFEKKL